MASTYPINYTFTKCINNGSSNTYTNDFVTYSMFKAKAVDGCFLQGTTLISQSVTHQMTKKSSMVN